MSWLQNVIDWLTGALVALAAAMGLGGGGPLQVQGYVEGEYVYVASPVAGRLETLLVARGAKVVAGAPLFQLDRSSEQPARDDAAARLAQAEANLANLRKGKRPSELEAIRAQLGQANAMLRLSAAALRRQEHLVATHVASREALDEASAAHARDTERVKELQAELQTAQLGARADEIQAAEAAVSGGQGPACRGPMALRSARPGGAPGGPRGRYAVSTGRVGRGGRARGPAAAARERQDPLLRARAAARDDRGRRRGPGAL